MCLVNISRNADSGTDLMVCDKTNTITLNRLIGGYNLHGFRTEQHDWHSVWKTGSGTSREYSKGLKKIQYIH